MTNANDVRHAHDLLDQLDFLKVISKEQKELLLSFLPERPAQKTLEELRREVYDAWVGANVNEWSDDIYGDLETWLYHLHKQLKGLEPPNPAHPEFLETEADYRKAPEGTIVACEDSSPWYKFDSAWLSTVVYEGNNAKNMTGVIREVLRWGWGE